MQPGLADWTQTTIDSDTLVQRLRDSTDQEAWGQVVRRYGPLLLAFARRLGLAPGQAEDARQETLMAFVHAIRQGRFDRVQGRLRDFLFGIARNKIIDALQDRRRLPNQISDADDGTGFFERIPDRDTWERRWEEEWNLAVSRQCLVEAEHHFTPDTYRTFVLRAIEDRQSAEVAHLTGKTVNAVDIAVSRVRTFLRGIRPMIEEVF